MSRDRNAINDDKASRLRTAGKGGCGVGLSPRVEMVKEKAPRDYLYDDGCGESRCASGDPRNAAGELLRHQWRLSISQPLTDRRYTVGFPPWAPQRPSTFGALIVEQLQKSSQVQPPAENRMVLAEKTAP